MEVNCKHNSKPSIAKLIDRAQLQERWFSTARN